MPQRSHGSITTVEGFLRRAQQPSGEHHELLRGEYTVTPAPKRDHQAVVSALLFALKPIIDGDPNLQLFNGPVDLTVGPTSVVQPDVFIADRQSVQSSWREKAAPHLVIEVISELTAGRDRGIKREIYQEAGISSYWVVDPAAHTIEAWSPLAERATVLKDPVNVEIGGASGVLQIAPLFTNRA